MVYSCVADGKAGLSCLNTNAVTLKKSLATGSSIQITIRQSFKMHRI